MTDNSLRPWALALGLLCVVGCGSSSSSSNRGSTSAAATTSSATTASTSTSSTTAPTQSGTQTTSSVVATRLSPTSGSEAVDVTVSIEGQNLDQVASVAFVPDQGGAPLALTGWAGVASVGTAVVPAGFATGDYRLELTDQAGTVIRAALTYEVLATPPATLTSLTPDRGANDRSFVVTVVGTGFLPGAAAQADVGGVAASATVISATEVEVTLPAGITPGVQPLTLSLQGQTLSGLSWESLNNSDPDLVGAYEVGYLDERIQGATGDRPDVRVYYPATQAGQGATPDPTGSFPVVVYNHGFRPPFISFGIGYRNNTFIAERLASFGYVVACVDLATNTSLFRSGQTNSQRDADDTIATLDHFERINADATHPLFGLLDPTRAALAGHSRGGVGALIAGAMEWQARGAASRVRALISFGPPSTDSRASNRPLVFGDFTQLPTLLIGGTDDGVAEPARQRDILALSGPPSMFAELNGGNHSQFKDSSRVILGDNNATLSLADQHAACQRYAVAWLGTHVKGQAALFADYVLRGAKVMTDTRLSAVDVR